MRVYFDGIIYKKQKFGGVSRYFTELLNNLKNVDCRLVVDMHTNLPTFTNNNIKIDKLWQIPNFKPRRFFEKTSDNLNYYIKNNYFKKIESGIFHSTYFTSYAKLSIPQVLTVHDMTYEKFPEYFKGKKHQEFLKNKKKCIQKAKSIICVSENTKRDLLKYYNISNTPIEVIYLAPSKNFFEIKDLNILDNFKKEHNIFDYFILYVGARGKYKNFNNFYKAFKETAKKNDINLILAGGGELNKDEKNMFKNDGLMQRVKHFHNTLDDDLNKLYNAAQLFVFPSLYEGFGLPTLEAMACNTPVALSNTSSLPEVGGDAAFYFDPLDIQNMKKVISKALSNENQMRQTDKRIRRAKKFSWQKTANNTVKVYKKLT